MKTQTIALFDAQKKLIVQFKTKLFDAMNPHQLFRSYLAAQNIKYTSESKQSINFKRADLCIFI